MQGILYAQAFRKVSSACWYCWGSSAKAGDVARMGQAQHGEWALGLLLQHLQMLHGEQIILLPVDQQDRQAARADLVPEVAKGSNRQYWEEKLTNGDEIQSKGFQDAREKLIQFQLNEANEEALALKDRMEKAEAQDDDLAEYD